MLSLTLKDGTMRVNVYSEELQEVDWTAKVAENTREEYIGARLYLKSHGDMFPPNHEDDDRSAITVWAHNTKEDRERVGNILYQLADTITKTKLT